MYVYTFFYFVFFSDITAPIPDFIKYAIANLICDMAFLFIYFFIFLSDITAPIPDFIKYAIANLICDIAIVWLRRSPQLT